MHFLKTKEELIKIKTAFARVFTFKTTSWCFIIIGKAIERHPVLCTASQLAPSVLLHVPYADNKDQCSGVCGRWRSSTRPYRGAAALNYRR